MVNKTATKPFRNSVISPALAAVLFARLVTQVGINNSTRPNTPTQVVRQSRKRAHQGDSYFFTSEIVQTITPLPLPGNVGMRSSQQFTLSEGSAWVERQQPSSDVFQISTNPSGGLAAKYLSFNWLDNSEELNVVVNMLAWMVYTPNREPTRSSSRQ